MAKFIESYSRTPDIFDTQLTTLAAEMGNILSMKQSPIRGSKICFYNYDYERSPVITAGWLESYVPFKIMGYALSLTDLPVEPTHEKSKLYSIASYKCNALNDNEDWPLQHAYDQGPSLPYGWDSAIYTPYEVSIIHTTERAEQDFANTWLENKGAVKDTLLSSMLMPTPSHTVRFFRDPARPLKVFITVNKISILLIHKIIGMLPILFSIQLAMLPVPPPAELFNSFIGMDADTFVTVASAWLRWVDELALRLKPIMTRAALANNIKRFGERISNHLQTGKQARLNDITNNVRTKEEEIKDLYLKLRDINLMMQTNQTSEIEELVDFLPRVRDLRGVDILSDYKIGFAIHTTLQHYSIDEARRIMESKRSHGAEDLARVIEYVFYKEEYHIVIDQGFFLNFRLDARECGENRYGKWITPDSYTERNTARNPHLSNFGNGCWGDNARFIDRALVTNSYLTAFNTALAAVRSVNLSDGIAMNHLYDGLLDGRYGACFLRESDGARFNITEFLRVTAPGYVPPAETVTATTPEVDLVNDALDTQVAAEIEDEDNELGEDDEL